MKAADLDILLQEGEGVLLEYKEGLSSSFAHELVALLESCQHIGRCEQQSVCLARPLFNPFSEATLAEKDMLRVRQ